MKAKILITSLLCTFLFLTSCNKDETEQQQNFTTDEATVNSKIDIANDDVSDIVIEQESNTYANSTNGKTTNLDSNKSALATCATISRSPDFGTPITSGTTITKTIDFGSGCTLNNGNTVKGKIIITFVYEPNATSHTITYTFDNFQHNNIAFTGNKTFTRTIVNNLPVITMNMEMTATYSGNVYTRVGQRVREFVSGYGDTDWTNNVYKVTGSWTTTYPNTSLQTSIITTPLIIKMSCVALNKPLIVEGVITFNRNNQSATLNYGNGECDNMAIFTINGLAFNIIIGK